jgi:cell wall-associated NlpC family hydrolase
VAAIEATITQEQQRSAALDQQYDAAQQDLSEAQAHLASLDVAIAGTRRLLAHDRVELGRDAVNEYIFNAPQGSFAALFTSSATQSDARSEYIDTAVGNVSAAAAALRSTEERLGDQRAQQQGQKQQAADALTQIHTLEAENSTATAAAQATLSQVKGTLAQEVEAAAQAQAAAEAAAAAAAANQAAAEAASAAAQNASQVAATVGADAGTGGSGTSDPSPTQPTEPTGPTQPTQPVVASDGSTAAGNAAVAAAESQLGVPYVWGAEDPGVGFDCSGLTQWAWAQAGVSIPRVADDQWADLPHVSLSDLEPGDLLFYYNLDGDNEVDHVVMYVGSGPYGTQTIIQAAYTGTVISYSPIFTAGLYGAAQP